MVIARWITEWETFVVDEGVAGDDLRRRQARERCAGRGTTLQCFIDVVGKRGRGREDEFAYDGDKGEGNAVTFGIVINSLCKTSRLDQILAVLEKIKHGDDGVMVKPDVVIYNTLINGLCKAGCQDEGLALIERMESEGQCVLNTVTYNCLIDGFYKAGELDKAL
ncbi:hypothetical protein Dimus_003964 [Dionaea muscipula]